MKIRSFGWRGLVVAAPLVVGSGIAALWLLPKLVRERVVTRVEERTGLHAQVGSVSLGLGSMSVEQLCVGDKSDGPSLCARAIELDTGPLMLALRGTRALSNVQVEELHVRLPLHAQASHTLIDRLLARAHGEKTEGAPEVHAPDVTIKHIAFELSDAQGELARVTGGRAHAGASGVELAIERAHFGEVAQGACEVEHVSVQGRRGRDGLQLVRADVAQARIWLSEQTHSAQGNALDAADTDADGDAPDPDALDARNAKAAVPAPTPALAPALPATSWQRVMSALASYRHAPGSAPGAQPSAPGSAVAAPPAASGTAQAPNALLSRLADGAVLTLQAATVYDASSQSPVLDKLRTTLKMQPGRTLSFSGSGGAQAGGALSWDLLITPERSHADGEVKLRSLPLSLIAPFLPKVPWYEPEHGRVDAELVIKTDPEQGVVFNGEASLRGGAIASERIAPTPVRAIDVSLHGHGRLLPLQHRLEIEEAKLALKNAELSVAGAIEWSADHYLFDIEANLPPTPCTAAVRAVPEDLLGDMSLASFQGKLSGHFRLKLDSRELDKTELEIAPSDHCDFVAVPAMADLRRFREPFTHSVLEPDGTLFEMETGPGTANWTSLEDISPYFVHAVLAHEDAGFFSHHGFSPRHIRDALVRNLKEGRYVVGASTITMQLVKNVFLHREKTLARKIQEVLLTWWIERVMEKRDIIELYLNVIEYGPAVYGIRNGARHYFNRMPSQLSPAESVYLATILPNPKRYHAYFERGALTPSWTEQMRKMLVRLRERGSYTPEATDFGMHELEGFHFYPEGTVVPARQLPGGAAPLPYLQALANEPGWGDDEVGLEHAKNAAPVKSAPPVQNASPAKGAPPAKSAPPVQNVPPVKSAPPAKGAAPAPKSSAPAAAAHAH